MEPISSAVSTPVSFPQQVEAPAAPVESAPQTESASEVGGAEKASPPAEWNGESSFESANSAPPPPLQLQPQSTSSTEPTSGVQPTGGTDRPAPVGQRIGNRTAVQLDGQVMTTDNGGTTWGTGTAPSTIPGANGRDTVTYINGIQNSPANAQNSLRTIESQGGTRAVSLYNASEGMTPLTDTRQTYADRDENAARANGTFQGQSRNAATRSLSDSIVNQLNNTQDPMHLMAHSQGGAITGNALYDARQRLVAQHGEARADEMLSRVQVETFGSAGRNFPNGPQYTHWINAADNVTRGWGPVEATGGRNAIFQRFNYDAPGDPANHNFESVYWRQRQQQFLH
jgi:hypothetical protein